MRGATPSKASRQGGPGGGLTRRRRDCLLIVYLYTLAASSSLASEHKFPWMLSFSIFEVLSGDYFSGLLVQRFAVSKLSGRE